MFPTARNPSTGRPPGSFAPSASTAVKLLASLGLHRGDQALPIHDRTPDPGLIGPDSVTWRVLGALPSTLGAPAWLLAQLADRRVAASILEFDTGFFERPFARLARAMEFNARVVFGTTGEAEAAINGLLRGHTHVKGTIPEAQAVFPEDEGAKYLGTDSRLQAWIIYTNVFFRLRAYEHFVAPLSPADRDRMVAEFDPIARRLRISERFRPQTFEQLNLYMRESIREGWAVAGPGSREAAAIITGSPFHSRVMSAAWQPFTWPSRGLLHAELRAGYQLQWTARDQARFEKFSRSMRDVSAGIPPHGAYRFAMSRVGRELPPPAPRSLRRGLPEPPVV